MLKFNPLINGMGRALVLLFGISGSLSAVVDRTLVHKFNMEQWFVAKKWVPENNYQYVINNIYSCCLQK